MKLTEISLSKKQGIALAIGIVIVIGGIASLADDGEESQAPQSPATTEQVAEATPKKSEAEKEREQRREQARKILDEDRPAVRAIDIGLFSIGGAAVSLREEPTPANAADWANTLGNAKSRTNEAIIDLDIDDATPCVVETLFATDDALDRMRDVLSDFADTGQVQGGFATGELDAAAERCDARLGVVRKSLDKRPL